MNPIFWQRIAHILYKAHIPLLPRLISYFIRIFFSCWIPHTIAMGKDVSLGYFGLGVVLHSYSKIGDRVEIGQNVTIGGNAIEEGSPTIGDDVYIGCGAKVLGPIKVGRGSIIGANSVVLKDVPENCVVAGIPARVVHEDIKVNQYLWHRKNHSLN